MSALEVVRLMNDEERAVLRAMDEAEEPLAEAAEKAAQAFRSGGRVIYVGAGTCGRVATMDAAEMPPTFGIDPDCFVAVVARGSAATSLALEDAEDDGYAGIAAIDALSLRREDVV